MLLGITRGPCTHVTHFKIDLCLFELGPDQIVLALLEKDKAALVSKTAIVAFFVDVSIWFLHFLKGTEVGLDH